MIEIGGMVLGQVLPSSDDMILLVVEGFGAICGAGERPYRKIAALYGCSGLYPAMAAVPYSKLLCHYRNGNPLEYPTGPSIELTTCSKYHLCTRGQGRSD